MRHRKELGERNEVGAKITALREKCHMSQKDLFAQMQSRGVNINPSSLSKLEGQARVARAEEIKVIAEIFQISVDELLR